MDKKICPDCGTENEKEYIYCKNCGTPLKSKPSAEEKPQATQFVSSDAVNGEQPKADFRYSALFNKRRFARSFQNRNLLQSRFSEKAYL